MKAPLAIFLCGLCLSLAVRGNDAETIDELLPLYAAVSLIDHGDFDIPIRDTYHPDFYAESPSGKYYPKFGPGQALILAPLAAIGHFWSDAGADPAERGRLIIHWALFFGSLVVPLIGVLSFQLWRQLGYASDVSAVSAILLMTTSQLLPYSRSLFGDLSCAGLAFSAFVSIARMDADHSWRAFMAGARLGLAVLVRSVTVLFVPAFLLYMILIWKRQSAPASVVRRQFVWAAVPFTLFCAALLLYNRHAFGSLFASGYGAEMFQFDQSLVAGVPHLLVSLEKGFFVYSPAAVLGFLFWKKFHRAHPAESVTALLFFVLHVLVYARWYAASPGNELSYGQRFLLPVVPFAYLFMPECVSWIRRNVAGWMFSSLLVFSFLVQIIGCLQKGTAFRAWASQYVTAPSYIEGYLTLSIQHPSSIAVWWWQVGGLAVAAGLALIALAGVFASRAVRPGCAEIS